MASKAFAVKNAAYTFRMALFGQSDNQILANPTLAAADFQVSIDGGAFANLGTLPDVDPDSSGQVLVTLAQAEMNGDEITVKAVDASGDEWHSAFVVIHTVANGYDSLSTLTAAQANTEMDTAISDAALATAAALATVDANVDSILEDTGTTLPATLAGLNNISAADVLTALEAATIDGTITRLQKERIELAVLAGLSTGGGTSTVNFFAQDDTTERVIATVDNDGNRTAVTLDGA